MLLADGDEDNGVPVESGPVSTDDGYDNLITSDTKALTGRVLAMDLAPLQYGWSSYEDD